MPNNPKNVPDNKKKMPDHQAADLYSSFKHFGIIRHLLEDFQASCLGLSGNFFGISHFLFYLKPTLCQRLISFLAKLIGSFFWRIKKGEIPLGNNALLSEQFFAKVSNALVFLSKYFLSLFLILLIILPKSFSV